MSPEPTPPRPDPMPQAPVSPRGPAADRPTATWRWWEAVLAYLFVLLVAGFATLPVFRLIRNEDLANLASTTIAAVLILGGLVFWLERWHPGWRRVVGLPRALGPELRAGVAFGALLYPAIVFGVGLVLVLLLRVVSGETVGAPEQVPQGLSAAGIAVTIVYGALVAPVGEELFFRGILFRAVRDRYGFTAGAVGSGVAFGLIHYLPGAWQDSVLLMGVMVFTGTALAWLYERRGNILAPIAAHVTFNVVGLSLIFALR